MGERIEISLYDAAVNLQTGPLASSCTAVSKGNEWDHAPLSAPATCSNVQTRTWSSPPICRITGMRSWNASDLSSWADERFATGPARARNRAELYALLAEVFATRPAAAWLAG